MKRNRQQYETKNSVMDNSAVLLTENNFSVLFSRRDKASGITLSSDSLTLYGCQVSFVFVSCVLYICVFYIKKLLHYEIKNS
jgi:hypothetical protein